MIIIGLTGSIAMGKSTAAMMFRRLGVPVYDADQAVHRLMAQGGRAVGPIGATFPRAVIDGQIDRTILGQQVFDQPEALRRLEAILHPLVREERRRFLQRAARQRRPLVVLDIPLLFETGAENECDAVCVVSAPRFVQEARLLKRPGMDRRRIQAIAGRQMPDREKRRRADVIIPSGLGRGVAFVRVRQVVGEMRRRRGGKWPSYHISRR